MTANKLVIDASVVIEWIARENTDREAKSIRLYKSLRSGGLTVYAPFFLLVEVANVLWWKKEKEVGGIREFVGRVRDSGINFVEGVFLPESIEEILELMAEHEITAYDAQYVYLAQKMGLKLATFDEKLTKIAGLAFDFEKLPS